MDTKKKLLETCRGIADEIENGDIEDYTANPLDYKFIVDAQKQYVGVEILVSFGGPNIYINTQNKTVEGYWGNDSVDVKYYDGEAIDDYFEQLYDC